MGLESGYSPRSETDEAIARNLDDEKQRVEDEKRNTIEAKRQAEVDAKAKEIAIDLSASDFTPKDIKTMAADQAEERQKVREFINSLPNEDKKAKSA
jgi:Ribonuclease G/E